MFNTGFSEREHKHVQILLVEDNLSLADGIKTALVKEGFVVNTVHSGKFAANIASSEPPDAMILDLSLPDLDGIDVLRRVKKAQPQVAVLILTARDRTEDKVQGLEAGADDYLAKPFDMPELIARLRVIERRLFNVLESTITVGPVSLSTTRHEAFRHGEPLELSRREYALLKSLMENAGRVVPRSTLETRLYSWDDEIVSNAIEVHIHNLRKKLSSDFIKTVRGVGYSVPRQ